MTISEHSAPAVTPIGLGQNLLPNGVCTRCKSQALLPLSPAISGQFLVLEESQLPLKSKLCSLTMLMGASGKTDSFLISQQRPAARRQQLLGVGVWRILTANELRNSSSSLLRRKGIARFIHLLS